VTAACECPLDDGALLAYWLDNREGPDVEAVEEHLFGCDSCHRRLRELSTLGEGIRRLAGEGAIEMVVSPSFLARAAAEGLRTREYRVTPGGSVACTVTPEDDLLVGRLVGNFKGVARLDLVAEQEGQPDRRIEDVPISPDATELIVAQAMPYVRALQHARLRMRLLAREPGGERLLGEYTFNHYPTVR
jgi:hypothetical protein